jgi:hypothetical protein
MADDEMIIFTKSYDYGLWLFKHTQKFPKSSRFSVSVRLELLVTEILEKIILANRAKNKMPLLMELDVLLERLRLLVRFSKDLGYLPLNSYEYSARQTDELGRLLGGWIKQQKS